MTDGILDVAKWKNEYSFLDNVWNKYNQFDNPVTHDENVRFYKAFCDPFMGNIGDHNVEQENFCLQLIRNLGCYPYGSRFFDPTPDNCKILHYWIYNSVRKHKISDKIITACFQDYIDYMRHIGRGHRCSYYSYDDMYEEPMNIIILDIFQSNINIIQNTLNREYVSTNFPLRKYICECIKIYKEMKPIYCPKSDAKSEKSNKTCEMLDTFKNTYESYLSSTQHENYKIKSLDNDEVEYLAMCPQDNNRSELTSESHGISSESASLNGVRDGGTVGISSHGRGINDEANLFTSSTDDNVENKGSPMSRTVSTAVGTVAGASSVLALLYKVNKEFHLNV
ncbi:hypothetical protein PVBG_04754 [Plasmodium vivax Brazil I]|uniref:Uncharacterized protein n=1 Tax=Plasmodium vivax (strain Brazil I) TaxID=1033975 RepID=A0A0J9SZI2_PLAV1|nr:hypothetical protein PVBG_04754 [Plasmodium vivax Brazil I]